MDQIDLHQGRDPEKVARDHEAMVKLVRWVIPALIVLGIGHYIFSS